MPLPKKPPVNPFGPNGQMPPLPPGVGIGIMGPNGPIAMPPMNPPFNNHQDNEEDNLFAALQEQSLNPQKALEKWAINLSELAANNKLKPVIGRHQEVKQVLEVLSQMDKNNPVLVGDPGVGKTAIVEAIAMQIAAGEVPESLKNKKLYSVNIANLKAGTGAHGQMEQRVKLIIDAASQDPNVILFADEFHLLVGTGKHATDASIDVANMLKPALARGQIKLIGATTHEEYQKYIKSDKAFLRRLQPINISESSPEETLAILRGLKSTYENHHKLIIDDQALVDAVQWAKRYLPQLHFPDKAISLIDRAAAALNLANNSQPEQLKILKDRLKHLKLEYYSLINSANQTSQIEAIEQAIATLETEISTITKQWQDRINLYQSYNDNKSEIISLNQELQQAIKAEDDERVQNIVAQIKELKTKLPFAHAGVLSLTSNEIAKAISDQTKIDLEIIGKSDGQRLLNLKSDLKAAVVGQDHAIDTINNALFKTYLQTNNKNRPIGSFLFLGQSGVGKTLLAKTLATSLFGDPKNFIRLDMSEYRDSMALTKLIGASAGYVGYHDRNQFSDLVSDRPYSVILIDEIEEAHPSVWSLFLQVLDEGRLKDNHGNIVDFRNTIIIMTSNIGANALSSLKNEHQVRDLIKANFPTKFLNRIDEVVAFNPLNEQLLSGIIDLKIKTFKQTMNQSQKLQHISVDFNAQFKDHLIERVLKNNEEGARLIDRIFDNDINNLITKYYLENSTNLKQTTIEINCDAKKEIVISAINGKNQKQKSAVLN